MNPVALFLVAVVVPVFFASTRSVSAWLSLQALTLASSVAAHHGLHSAHAALAVVEIVVVRGVIAPLLLHRVSNHEQAADHLLPSNLFAWMLGISVAGLAFEFSAITAHGEVAFALGSVSATVVISLLLLSFNTAGIAQIFALLLLENAALLFESTLPSPWSIWVHGALTCIYVLTVWVGTRLIEQTQDESALALPRQSL